MRGSRHVERGRIHLGLGLIVLVAVAAVAWLLLGEGFLGGSDDAWRGEGGGGAGEMTEAGDGGARLTGRPGERPEPEEDEEALRAPTVQDVFGLVVDGRGTPIPGAKVEVFASQEAGKRILGAHGSPVASTRSDREGRYVVGPLPEDRLLVRAQATGYAATVELLPMPGGRLDLVLAPGGSLRVAVSDVDGRPVEGAHVVFGQAMAADEATTDAEGRARLLNLAAGNGTLIVTTEDEGGVRLEGVAVAVREERVQDVVLPGPVLLQGTVVEKASRRPVAGARVVVEYPISPFIEETGGLVTGPDGTFETPLRIALQGTALLLRVEAEGLAPARLVESLREPVADAVSATVEMVPPRPPITGRVEDLHGELVAGAQVGLLTGRGDDDELATTDALGRFTLTLPASLSDGGQLRLVAAAPDHGVAGHHMQLPPSPEPVEEVTLVLQGAGRFAGVVRDGSGQPVHGALVDLEIDWRGVFEERGRDREAWIALQAAQNPRLSRTDAVTDPQGRFELVALPAAVYVVNLAHGLERMRLEERVVLAAGDDIERELTLGEGARIEGFVTDPAGMPVEGASITVRPERRSRAGTVGSQRSSATSLEDGTFIVHGVVGEAFRVDAAAAGYQGAQAREVAPGTTGVSLVLQPFGWIEGVVRHQGRPYRGTFQVRMRAVTDEEGNQPRRGRRGRTTQRTFSSEDGRFRLEGTTAGAYEVSASTADGLTTLAPTQVTVHDGQPTRVELELYTGAVLAGRVVEDATGAPLEGVTVRVRPQDDDASGRGFTRTDAQGHFEVRGLGGGQLLVQVTPPDGGATIEQTVELEPGEQRTMEVRRLTPGAIRFVVTGPDGAPLEGVRPRVESAAGTIIWPNWRQWRNQNPGRGFDPQAWRLFLATDAQGVNLRQDLAPGPYTVTVEGQGWETPPPRQVQVTSGATAEIRFTLTPAPR